jgi:hypothetical protein
VGADLVKGIVYVDAKFQALKISGEIGEDSETFTSLDGFDLPPKCKLAQVGRLEAQAS